MMLRNFTFTICFFLSALALQAQLSGGVKIGLNFSNLKGPLEQDAAGANVEQYKNYTGFHIGPAFSYAFSDRFGLRGEVLYSKKGFKYEYSGAGYRTFTLDNNQGTISNTGTTKLGLSVNLNGFDLPVMGYARLGNLELTGGAYASVFVIKVAEGAMQYSWKNLDGSDGSIELLQRHNYNKDKFGEGDATNTVVATVNAKKATLPQIAGAYYDFPEDRGKLYKTLDYGLIGGAAYYLSSTLYVGARLQYGLADLTNTNADVSRQTRNADGSLITRADNDHNFTIQASVGFSF